MGSLDYYFTLKTWTPALTLLSPTTQSLVLYILTSPCHHVSSDYRPQTSLTDLQTPPSSLAWPDLTVSVYCYTAIPGFQCDLTRAGNWNRIELSFHAFCIFRGQWVHILQLHRVFTKYHTQFKTFFTCVVILSPPTHLLNICHLWHIALTPL